MAAASPTPVPPPAASADTGAATTGLGRAIDLTARLATSWVGLLTAYAGAVLAAVVAFQKLKEPLSGVPLWARFAIVAALPVLALVFHTIPALVEQRRKKHLTEITGSLQPGYFQLAPREDEASFKRADGKHQEVLRWLQQSSSPILGWQIHRGDKRLELSFDGAPPKGSYYALARINKPLTIRLRSVDSNISELAGVKNFTLDLSGIKVSDVSPLKGLKNLTTLDLGYTPVSDVSPLKDLTNLTTLDLGYTPVSDVSPLKDLTNLTTLNLGGTKVKDVSPLKELRKLTWLNLRNTPVSDVSPLKGLTKLTTLNLYGTPVSDVSPLKELTNLTYLYLRGTQVSDVSPLKELTNLTYLDLRGTKVSDVSPLKGLKNLKIIQ